MRHRPHRIAPAQSRAGIGDAVHQPVRHGLRQRRLPPGHGAGARARRLGRVSGAARGGAERAANTAASASAITSTPRPARRASGPRSRYCRTGGVEVVVGTVSNGQGHETSFAQLISEWLGVPIDSVRLVTGDTDRVSVGGGSHSGRALRLASIVMLNASRDIIEKGLQIASHVLEAAAADLEFADGRFRVKGTDRVARHLRGRGARRCGATICRRNLRGPLARRKRRDRQPRQLPLWLPCLRGRGRSRHRGRRDRALQRGRRCRARGQPDDRARPDPWRHRPGASARR